MSIFDFFKKRKNNAPKETQPAEIKMPPDIMHGGNDVSRAWVVCPGCGMAQELWLDKSDYYKQKGYTCIHCELDLQKEHTEEELKIAKRIGHIHDLINELYKNTLDKYSFEYDERLAGESDTEYHRRNGARHSEELRKLCVERVKGYISDGQKHSNEWFEFYKFVQDNNIELSDYLKTYFG
ncbi:MAG: hypothetical protein IJA60_01055 [Clostridia bacterium]|nr:hypothetical protein [Clostridia bacterium]